MIVESSMRVNNQNSQDTSKDLLRIVNDVLDTEYAGRYRSTIARNGSILISLKLSPVKYEIRIFNEKYTLIYYDYTGNSSVIYYSKDISIILDKLLDSIEDEFSYIDSVNRMV